MIYRLYCINVEMDLFQCTSYYCDTALQTSICLCSWRHSLKWGLMTSTPGPMSTPYEDEFEIVCIDVFEYCNLIYLLYVKSVLKINVYFHNRERRMNEFMNR